MDPLTIGMLVILAVLIFFMFRNSRKRKAQQEELRSAIVPGAAVMTNFGLYGTLVSMDEVTKVAELEVAPGNIVRVHSQTIAKVVDPIDGSDPSAPRSVEEAMAIATREEEERAAASLAESPAVDEPAYGERVEATGVETADAADLDEKPVRRSTKKAAE